MVLLVLELVRYKGFYFIVFQIFMQNLFHLSFAIPRLHYNLTSAFVSPFSISIFLIDLLGTLDLILRKIRQEQMF
jgi:hypothetical protein